MMTDAIQTTTTAPILPNGNGNGRMKQQHWVQRVIVSALVVLATVSVIAIAVLALLERECPPALAALGAATIGALASALSPARPS